MAKKSSSLTPSWARQRNLIAIETVLVIGVLQEYAQRAVQGSTAPNAIKVAFIMAAVIGLLGGLVLLVQSALGASAARLYAWLSSLPIPLMTLHLIAFALLFWWYSRVWQLPVL
jgi:hypothetical protein